MKHYAVTGAVNTVFEFMSITPSAALRLSKFFGVPEDFWLSLQLCWDLYEAMKTEAKEIEAIRPLGNAEKIA